MSYGFIYCLTNRYMPGICKIGFTDRSPSQRCKELSASTSVPEWFSVEFYAEVDGAAQVEKQMHAAFTGVRVSSSREFFSCAPAEAFHRLMCNADFATSYVDGDCAFELDKLIAANEATRKAIQKATSEAEGF